MLSAPTILFLVIVPLIIVLISWLIAHVFGESTQAPSPSLLPKVGTALSGAFLHRREQVHVYCRIEDSEKSRLLVRIMSELGKSSLLGMRPGTSGQLEIGNYWLPIEVLNVSLPWVTVKRLPTGQSRCAENRCVFRGRLSSGFARRA
jgi:hypothetical protein